MIFRVEKNRNYSVINNEFLRNEKLSLRAKGLLAYFLTLPNDWRIYLNEVVKHSKEGKDAVRSAVKELECFGYVEKERTRNKDGKFNGWLYVINELPKADLPKAEKPTSVDPPLLNTDLNKELKELNTKRTNNINEIGDAKFSSKKDNKTITKRDEAIATLSNSLNATKEAVEILIEDEEKYQEQKGNIPEYSFIVSNINKLTNEQLHSYLLYLNYASVIKNRFGELPIRKFSPNKYKNAISNIDIKEFRYFINKQTNNALENYSDVEKNFRKLILKFKEYKEQNQYV